MALVIKDRVRQTSTTAGTGTITLSGSVTGYQNFSVIGTGNTTYYTIADQSGSNWEVGLGTYTAPNQLARTTVYESSNGNALVNFGSNIKDVFVTLPAEGFASPPAIGGTTPNTIAGTTITANTAVNLPSAYSQVGTMQMVYNAIDDYYYLNLWTDDVGIQYGVNFPGGITAPFINGVSNFTATGAIIGGSYQATAGSIQLDGDISHVTLKAPTGAYVATTLTLPNSTGSANQVLKTDGSGNLSWTTQGVQGTAPVTVTAATYTVAATDQWIIGNRAGTITLTLPTASSSTGRSINVKTITANTVISASSNVVQRNSTTVSTAILAATAGTWATLVSDGANWVIMAGN